MDLRAELCKTCIHTKVCVKDKNIFGDNFVGGNPMFTDNAELYKKYEIRKAAGFPCDDYVPYNQWIPCSERLPEKSDDYLCTYGSLSGWFVDISIYETEKKEFGFYSENEHGEDVWYPVTNVVAWMPLPKPWRAES